MNTVKIDLCLRVKEKFFCRSKENKNNIKTSIAVKKVKKVTLTKSQAGSNDQAKQFLLFSEKK